MIRFTSATGRGLETGTDAELAISIDDEALEFDLADLPDDELAALERELLADVRLAVGLSRTLRNRRMRERGALSG